jgi:hypothetical protein
MLILFLVPLRPALRYGENDPSLLGKSLFKHLFLMLSFSNILFISLKSMSIEMFSQASRIWACKAISGISTAIQVCKKSWDHKRDKLQ